MRTAWLDGGTAHALVLAIAVVGLLNTLGEQLGWRGLLQDALRPLPRREAGGAANARWVVGGA